MSPTRAQWTDLLDQERYDNARLMRRVEELEELNYQLQEKLKMREDLDITIEDTGVHPFSWKWEIKRNGEMLAAGFEWNRVDAEKAIADTFILRESVREYIRSKAAKGSK